MSDLFDFTDEQLRDAETVVARMASGGIAITVDEAQIMANLSALGQKAVAEDPKTLTTKATRELVDGKSPLSEACLAIIAQSVARQHRLGDEDINLRALDTIDTMLAVLASLTRKPKLKHGRG